jgi:hypothetical protein
MQIWFQLCPIIDPQVELELPEAFFESPIVLNAPQSGDGDEMGHLIDMFTNSTLAMIDNDNVTCTEEPYNMCFRTKYIETYDKVYLLCEIVLVAWSMWYLISAAREVSFLGWRLFMKTVAMCPSR